MKTKAYEVPADLMPEFAKIVEEWDIPCSVMGVNDDGWIEIEVDYEPEEKEAIHELNDLMEEHLE